MSKAKKRPMLDSDSDESDSDSEESSQAKKSKLSDVTMATSTNTARSSSSGSSSDDDDEWTFEGGKGQKVLKKRSRKRESLPLPKKTAQGKKQSKLSSDSSDSDEDSPQTGNKAASVSSDSSTSDSSDSDDDDDDDSDSSESTVESESDLIKDEEDRLKLESMTDVQRELELYKRHEQRAALRERQKILKMVKKEQKSKKKKKDHDNKSRILRAKEPKQTKTTRAIDELKAVRTADKQKKAERKSSEHSSESGTIKKQPLQVSNVYSSDDEEDGGGSSTLSTLKAKGSKFATTIDELSKIKLSRYRLEKWVHMPFFEKIIQGCYVRIGIGQHEGRMIYRICEIVNVQETPKVYSLGTSRTNKGLKLRFGTQERLFRMEYISNSQFTETEITKWKAEHEAHNIAFPTLKFVEKKMSELDDTKNVNLKEEDIDKIINEKQKFRKNPHNYALAKNRMIRDKEIAEQLGDEEKAASLIDQLSQLEERAEELDRRRSKGLSAITYINERNRQRNVERAEEALKEEMANIRDKEEDPFTRRKCMPRLVTFSKDGTEAVELGATETKNSSVKTGETDSKYSQNDESILQQDLNQTPLNSISLLSTPTSSTDTLRNRVDDLFTAHDFDISIDLPTATQDTDLIKVIPKQVTTPKNDGPRRSLNLSDYKKRRGLI